MPTPARPMKWALRNGKVGIVTLSGRSSDHAPPVHRIREAHGCEHLFMPATPATRNLRSVADRNQGGLAPPAETPSAVSRPSFPAEPQNGTAGPRARYPRSIPISARPIPIGEIGSPAKPHPSDGPLSRWDMGPGYEFGWGNRCHRPSSMSLNDLRKLRSSLKVCQLCRSGR
jgi:hypothetical protein